jgi:hypothetical protein
MLIRICFAWIAWMMIGVSDSHGQDLHKDFTPAWNFNAVDEDVVALRRRFLTWVPRANLQNQEARRHFFQNALDHSLLLHRIDSMNLLMATDTMTRLLNHLADHIIAHNPSIDSTAFRLFTFRGTEANAYNLGEGIIFFNVAMLERLQSVDQLAFIVAHEMAHELEKHVFESAVSYSKDLYEQVFQTDSVKTRRKRMRRIMISEPVLDKFNTERLRFKRDMELVSDSIGFMLAVNAGFDGSKAIDMVMASLMETGLAYTDTIPFETIFHFSGMPFQPHWLVVRDMQPPWGIDSSLYEEPDSLLTHPVWSTREEKMRHHPLVGSNSGVPFPFKAALQEQLASAPFESLASLIQHRDFSNALYNALHLHQQYPENVFVNAVIVHSLMEIGNSLKQGQFLYTAGMPGMMQSGASNHFLHFLHNLRREEFTALYRAFREHHLTGHHAHPYVAFLQEIESGVLTRATVDAYDKKYNAPFYTAMLNQLVPETSGKK